MILAYQFLFAALAAVLLPYNCNWHKLIDYSTSYSRSSTKPTPNNSNQSRRRLRSRVLQMATKVFLGIKNNFCRLALVVCDQYKSPNVYKSFFLKNGPLPASFSLFLSFQYTVDSKKMLDLNNFLPMTGFEPRTSGIGSDCFTNWATTTAPKIWDLWVFTVSR